MFTGAAIATACNVAGNRPATRSNRAANKALAATRYPTLSAFSEECDVHLAMPTDSATKGAMQLARFFDKDFPANSVPFTTRNYVATTDGIFVDGWVFTHRAHTWEVIRGACQDAERCGPGEGRVGQSAIIDGSVGQGVGRFPLLRD